MRMTDGCASVVKQIVIFVLIINGIVEIQHQSPANLNHFFFSANANNFFSANSNRFSFPLGFRVSGFVHTCECTLGVETASGAMSVSTKDFYQQ